MPQGPTTKPIPLELIEKLPKTDLHVHLDGSLRLATILELAERQRIELPAHDEDGLREAMHLGQNCGSLVEYLKAFDVTLRVMQTEESLCGASPTSSPRTPRARTSATWRCATRRCSTRAAGCKLTTVVEACSRGCAQAQEKHGIESNVIICGIRNVSPESSLEMAELAVAYKGRGVVGFDLAGAEYDHPAKHHKQRSSSSATTTSTSPSTPARPTARSRSPRRSTCAARTASATAAACARTATSCTT